MSTLHWLPKDPEWKAKARAFRADAAAGWTHAMALANNRLDFIETNMLDTLLRERFGTSGPDGLHTAPIRLAILGSSTMTHLHAGIRVAAARRGLWVETYESDYGQYRQELADPSSGLHAFGPTAILFAFDARHAASGCTAALTAEDAQALDEAARRDLAGLWRMAQDAFRCPVLHQTVLPTLPALMGGNEHRLPGSGAAFIRRLNADLRALAAAEGVHLLAIDDRAARDGMAAWHDPALWHRSKQDLSPKVAPVYGDLVARLLAALQGRSAKCLVLDLDNTLWGGVIGDDGLEGIALGQGNAVGEGFAAVQAYAKELAARGIILAVCSKNDDANAREPFEKHPEMVLKLGDIACFVANWQDKASNLRRIAAELNIGIDSLVFLDDNPAEREVVRRELPMVAVPEAPEDPALVPDCLADAGYFEGLSLTDEDRARTASYHGNRARAALQESATDLPAFLRSLDMQLSWRHFDRIGLQRIVQLINKTNQFNLTTRRMSEEEVLAVIDDPDSFGLQLRLKDRFGDNGIIAIVIGRRDQDSVLIDTWLMSCRVLGRQVEAATLGLLAEQARRLGARRLVGVYRPTAKNAMVREHYQRLSFKVLAEDGEGGHRSALDLDALVPTELFMSVVEE